jgi:hypothetical protein
LLVLFVVRTSVAQPTPNASSSASIAPSTSATPTVAAPTAAAPDAKEVALDLLKKGVALFKAGEYARALDFFLQSREALPRPGNTINAALCLEKLQRLDEALELYDEVLARFGGELDDADRTAVTAAIGRLRPKVGAVVVSANVVGATVLVDGRARATLPLGPPILAVAGKHVVRVVKDGYVTWEGSIDVQAGLTSTLDAKLSPLAQAGQLRVEDATSEGAEVFVDRVRVGKAPWEGTLGPGKHVVWTRNGDRGSAPAMATVIQGQTVLLKLTSKPLGAPVRIDITPATASVSIDGIDLGPGTWEGRLPIGAHALVVAEDGYFPASESIASSEGAPVTRRIALVVDPDHPRWPKATRGRIEIGLFGGGMLGTSLGAGAESGCPDACTSEARVIGGLGGLRVGYRLGFGLGFELAGGYMSLATKVTRSIEQPAKDTTVVYALEDKLSVSGAFVAIAASQRFVFGSLSLTGRFGVGVLFARARDLVDGTARTDGPAVAVGVDANNQVASAAAPFLAPEIGAAVRVGRFDVGLAVAVFAFLGGGPSLPNGALKVPADVDCTTAPHTVVQCAAADNNAIAHEAGFGRFFVVVPQLQIATSF